MSWSVRHQFWNSGTTGDATQQFTRAVACARIIVYAKLGKPIGAPDSSSMARRESADDDETTLWSTSRLGRANPSSSAIERIRYRTHRAGRRRSEAFPKPAIYCHQLSFCSRKTAASVSTVAYVAVRGYAGQPVIRHGSLVVGYRTVLSFWRGKLALFRHGLRQIGSANALLTECTGRAAQRPTPPRQCGRPAVF
jgi:hypothetical protein